MAKDNVEMASSDFNLIKLETSEFQAHVRASLQLGTNLTVFGRRGSGKTEIIKTQIAEANFKEVYVNLSVFERVDMGGYPNIMQSSDDFVNFRLPNFYREMLKTPDPQTGPSVVALLDEVDKADPSLWAPLLEFTQFKSINGLPLPNLRAVCMTGNLISEGGLRPSPPLLDRCEKYLLEANASAWLAWAGKTGAIHPSITAYINDNGKDLFGATDPDDRYADASPRGWYNASQILFKGEKFKMSKDLLNRKVSGCIGKQIGLKFSHYYDHYMELLPMVEQIYGGVNIVEHFKNLEPTKKLVTCMIVCSRLANQLDSAPKSAAEKSDKLSKELNNVAKFLKNCKSEENVYVSIRSQVTLPRIMEHKLDEDVEWKPLLHNLNKKVIGS